MTFNFLYSSDSQLIYKARSYTYYQKEPRAINPIDIGDLKPHLKLDYIDDDQENYLQLLVRAAVDVAERFTNRSFINQSWVTYRDFPEGIIELRKGTRATLTSFKYRNINEELTVVPSDVYYIKVQDPYSKIIIKDTATFPSDISDQQNSIEIEFIAGYGATKESIPPALRLLLCQHVTWLYENKGNCLIDELPKLISDAYAKYFRVLDLNAATYL